MEKMWFLFKILHVRGRNTCLCKGELCFVLLGGVFTSFFLYNGLVTIFTYIVLHLPLHVLFLFSLYIHISLLYAIFYFCFTLRCFNEFSLKCFRNIGCQSLPCHELSSCKFFQEFVLG